MHLLNDINVNEYYQRCIYLRFIGQSAFRAFTFMSLHIVNEKSVLDNFTSQTLLDG